ncbi:MAG TPA: prenyltransferase/squalene oxidase repeat-containing protein [Gemmataceae bacterium]|nr:prenyltransferase/squalene oxidase repeat-containing protein [Gemmataceae bacterium]
MHRLTAVSLGLVFLVNCRPVHGQESKSKGEGAEHGAALTAARDKGLDWLAKNQAMDGSWGKTYPIAATSFACLAYLSAGAEPFEGAHGRALVKGLEFILANQDKGMFKQNGHSWIHGQGFATLALAEAYGRTLFCRIKPDLDMKKTCATVEASVKIIGENQSHSGGWWYTPGSPNQHEGSTTVCAVQALVSAQNFGMVIDEKVLDKGFEYLKKCQAKDGGFNYQLGDGTSMKEGTAAAVATLGLMQKFDFQVMINGFNFLQKTTPAVISKERFPYYGHFYGSMGMHLLYQEYKGDKVFETKTQGYIRDVHKDLLAWQHQDGSWPLKGWVVDGNMENAGYSTAFALIALQVPTSRLSIHNRIAPKLPTQTRRQN